MQHGSISLQTAIRERLGRRIRGHQRRLQIFLGGHIPEVERVMLPKGMNAVLMDVQLARGLTSLGIGRYVEAYEHLIRLFEHGDPAWHETKRCWVIGDFAEAARHSGHLEEARALLPEMEAILSQTRTSRLCLARVRPPPAGRERRGRRPN